MSSSDELKYKIVESNSVNRMIDVLRVMMFAHVLFFQNQILNLFHCNFNHTLLHSYNF